ncbi:hypothetical protein PM082_007564 [Marasmius tenuissimus]|nr:hypothetical protein PM082_007564 [Marasmius tenuissimus]
MVPKTNKEDDRDDFSSVEMSSTGNILWSADDQCDDDTTTTARTQTSALKS